MFRFVFERILRERLVHFSDYGFGLLALEFASHAFNNDGGFIYSGAHIHDGRIGRVGSRGVPAKLGPNLEKDEVSGGGWGRHSWS